MYYSKLLFLFLVINLNCLSAQVQIQNNENQYMKNYIRFGFGRLGDYINFGGGLFFPVSERFMLGARGNVNSEIEILKTPSENLLDISLSVRYIPLIWNNFVSIVGCGVGYARGEKRGELIRRPVLIGEEYEKEKFNSVTFLAELEVGYFITKFLGISISGYSVLSSKKNIVAYQVSLFLYGLNSP